MVTQESITLVERVRAPTPKFFRVLRNIGLVLTAVGTTVITAGVALPAVVVSVAGYMVAAGAAVAAVSQTTVDWKRHDLGSILR